MHSLHGLWSSQATTALNEEAWRIRHGHTCVAITQHLHSCCGVAPVLHVALEDLQNVGLHDGVRRGQDLLELVQLCYLLSFHGYHSAMGPSMSKSTLRLQHSAKG